MLLRIECIGKPARGLANYLTYSVPKTEVLFQMDRYKNHGVVHVETALTVSELQDRLHRFPRPTITELE